MREIKFRGWDEKNKEMVCNINLLFSNCLNDCFEEYEECGLKIMQYTGLKDKNGKEIYEGDIVEGEDHYNYRLLFNGTVGFKDGSFVIFGECITHYRWMDYSVEIIGNIHESEVKE